jgi:hypothetical protein
MSSVDTVEGLLAVWGRGAFTPDPLKSLADQGVVIGDALHQRLTAGQHKRVSAAARAALVDRLRDLGVRRERLGVSALPRAAKTTTLPEGAYDLIIGIRLSLADEVLAGAYETLTWPNELKAADVRQLVTLADLRALSDEVPDVDGLEIGTVHLPEPPTTSAGPGGKLFVTQHFVLDLDVIESGSPAPTTITFLDATLRFNAAVSVQQDPEDPERLAVLLGTLPADLVASTITVSATSALQARSDAALDAFAERIGPASSGPSCLTIPRSAPSCRSPWVRSAAISRSASSGWTWARPWPPALVPSCSVCSSERRHSPIRTRDHLSGSSRRPSRARPSTCRSACMRCS